jgi:hypothetical protein
MRGETFQYECLDLLLPRWLYFSAADSIVPYAEEQMVCVKDNVLILVNFLTLRFPFVRDKKLYRRDRHDEKTFRIQNFVQTTCPSCL